MTHVPPLRFTTQGIEMPSEAEILDGVLADFQAAFGGGLNPAPETPQGQLAASLAAVIADKNAQIAFLVNQVHPDFAESFMQDAIGKIYFIERKPATDSLAECEFYGLAGTRIPQGFVLLDDEGRKWQTLAETGIPESGVVKAAVGAKGSLKAAAGSISRIYQSLPGLDRVRNPQSSLPGRPEESRAEFAERRLRSVAVNAHGTPQAVYANLFALEGVQDVYVVDNPKGQPETVNGYTLKPHSIYAAVVGGDDKAVADVLLRFAGCGCDFNGNTEITLYDDNYTDPKPAYTVAFMRPEDLPVYIRVTVERGAPAGLTQQIQEAVAAVFESRIGGTLYAVKFAAALAPLGRVLDVAIGTTANPSGSSIRAGIHQKPVIGGIEVAGA